MPMTYAALAQALQDIVEDDGTEFVAAIPLIIERGHDRCVRDLDLSIFQGAADIPTVAAQSFVARPSEASVTIEAIDGIYFVSGSKVYWLERRSTGFVRDYQNSAATAKPKYYAEYDETNLELAPIPDAVYTLKAELALRPAPPTSGGGSTWIMVHCPTLLTKACLAETEEFLKADDRVAMWQTDYTTLLPTTKRDLYPLLRARYQLTPLEVPAVPTVAR